MVNIGLSGCSAVQALTLDTPAFDLRHVSQLPCFGVKKLPSDALIEPQPSSFPPGFPCAAPASHARPLALVFMTISAIDFQKKLSSDRTQA
ncbi:MAG: hypothetical protein ACO1TE_24365 [Prosthecobacter sp.]